MYPHSAHPHTENWVGQIQNGRLAAILNDKIAPLTSVLGSFLSQMSYGADTLHVDVSIWYLKKIMKGRHQIPTPGAPDPPKRGQKMKKKNFLGQTWRSWETAGEREVRSRELPPTSRLPLATLVM